MESKKGLRISLLGMIALCMANFAYMADLVIIPIGDTLFAAFPTASSELMNFILSGPQLIMVFSMLLSTVLMRYIRKERLILIGFAAFTAASCFGAAVNHPVYVAVMRATSGFFGGFCTPVAMSLINETYYDDPEKGGAMIGYFCSSNAVFGLVMSVAAGILCAKSWQNAFCVYYAAVPMLIFMCFFLPKTELKGKGTKAVASDGPKERMPWGKLLLILLAVVVGAIVINACNYLGSVYLAERGLGTSSFAGVFTALITLMTAVISAMYGVIYAKLRRYTGVLMFVLQAVGYLVLIVAQSPATALIGAAINGCAYGLLASYYAAVITEFVPVSQLDTATPLVLAALGIGSFLSTYAAFGLMGILGVAEFSSVFPHLLVLCLAGAAVSALVVSRQRKGKVQC